MMTPITHARLTAIDVAELPDLADLGELGTVTGVTLDRAVFDYTASIRFDWRLYRQDITGSIAHVRMLAVAVPDIMPSEDAVAIEAGLRDVLSEIDDVRHRLVPIGEDIHSHVELRLRQVLEARFPGRGEDMGRRLHTARSRNDQVATDVRLWVREACVEIVHAVCDLQDALIERAALHTDAPFPGYTHVQNAQPVTWGHHLHAYVEMLRRDVVRFDAVWHAANILPLGSAALAGTSFPIRRDLVADSLGFAGISANSMDAVSDRDFAIEFASASSILIAHLSRFAEDITLWATSEFGLVRLSSRWAEGSSIMPQKRNPDAAELTRGKAGRVFGHLQHLLVMQKGLPMTYGRDLQDDKEALFDTARTVRSALRALTVATSSLEIDRERASARASAGYSTATDLADYLVGYGVPFRTAYEVVKRLVIDRLADGRSFADMTSSELREYHPAFEDDALHSATVAASVASRDIPGGTAPRRVSTAVDHSRRQVGEARVTWASRE
jgi:argininosuccinate lyase